MQLNDTDTRNGLHETVKVTDGVSRTAHSFMRTSIRTERFIHEDDYYAKAVRAVVPIRVRCCRTRRCDGVM